MSEQRDATTARPPLADVTVLDLSTVGPGSRCSAMLADLGAEVVKIGRADGGGITPEWWAYGAGRGARRIRLDLTRAEGRDVFLRLAGAADVVIDSFRPGVVDELGIGYDAVREVNPRIVYAALTGYGQDGPYSRWADHDIDYLAVSGFLSVQGHGADGKPAMTGATVADAAGGGMHAALAITAALVARAATGEGTYLDVSATEGMLSIMSLHVDRHLATGAEVAPGTDLLTGRYACYDTYECSDGKFVAVGAIEPRFFANLMTALDGEVFIPMQYNDQAQETVRGALTYKFSTRTRDEWVADLAPQDTCVAPVLEIDEVVDDPHHIAREVFASTTHPDAGTVRQVGPVLAGGRRGRGPFTASPAEASDAAALLTEAGVDEAEIATLLESGVVA